MIDPVALREVGPPARDLDDVPVLEELQHDVALLRASPFGLGERVAGVVAAVGVDQRMVVLSTSVCVSQPHANAASAGLSAMSNRFMVKAPVRW